MWKKCKKRKWLVWMKMCDVVGMHISSISDNLDIYIYIYISICMDYVYYTWMNAILELEYDWISNIGC